MKLCTVCGVVTSRAGSRCTEHARQSNRSRHNALTHTAMYEQLVANHGWTSDDYESWLAGALRRDIRDSTQALGHEIER